MACDCAEKKDLYIQLTKIIQNYRMEHADRLMLAQDLPNLEKYSNPTVQMPRRQFIEFKNSFIALTALAIVVIEKEHPDTIDILRWIGEKTVKETNHEY